MITAPRLVRCEHVHCEESEQGTEHVAGQDSTNTRTTIDLTITKKTTNPISIVTTTKSTSSVASASTTMSASASLMVVAPVVAAMVTIMVMTIRKNLKGLGFDV